MFALNMVAPNSVRELVQVRLSDFLLPLFLLFLQVYGSGCCITPFSLFSFGILILCWIPEKKKK